LLKKFFKIFYPGPVLDFPLKKSAIFGWVLHGKMVSEKNENIHRPKATAYLSRWCTPLANKKRICVQTSLLDV
jgi:hypothetical protein